MSPGVYRCSVLELTTSKIASIETVLQGYEAAASAEVHTLIADVRAKL
jgi:hypothetical protein